jgi:hypothetical protein
MLQGMFPDSILPKDQGYAFALTPTAVERFRNIMRREYSEELTPEAAWARAIEVLALFRALVGPFPEGTSSSSNIEAIDQKAQLGQR